MNKVTNAIKWIFHNFFFIAIVVFVIFYLRWFRLTPFVYLDDPTFAFLGGFVLLTIYSFSAIASSRIKHTILKTVFYFASVTFLFINAVYLNVHMPRIVSTATCNGITYYITHNKPLFDEQWSYIQKSKWEGVINYKSFFQGYAPGVAGDDIICDIERKEALFFGDNGVLSFIDGEDPQGFYEYTSAQLKDKLYILSENWSLLENCNTEEYWSCDVFVYTLYECRSNYIDCNPLSITYARHNDDNFLELRADTTTNEVRLFEQYSESDDETLIFTYGENSHCYVDDCTINIK